MSSKYKVTFLLDKTNLWFEKQLMNYDFKLSKKYYFNFSKNPKEIKNQHIVFPLSYTKILPESFLKNNELVLIAHPSIYGFYKFCITSRLKRLIKLFIRWCSRTIGIKHT